MALPKGETGQTGTSSTSTGLERRDAAASGDPKEGRGGRPLESPAAAEEREEEAFRAREESEERSEEREEISPPALFRAEESEAREEESEETSNFNPSAFKRAAFCAA